MINYSWQIILGNWENGVMKVSAKRGEFEGLDYMPITFKDEAEFLDSELYRQMLEDAARALEVQLAPGGQVYGF